MNVNRVDQSQEVMEHTPGTILVVDDEPQIARVVRSLLVLHGYEVAVASDGLAAIEKFVQSAPDLVITDISMPRMDGITLCSEIRSRSSVPILVLSVIAKEDSKVQALDAGADDYLTKPFSAQELLARVRALMRRGRPRDETVGAALLSVGDFRIDQCKRLVEVRGRKIHLSPKEFDLLFYMAQHSDRVLTHRTLLDAVWGTHGREQQESLRVLVAMLRRKIEPGEQWKYIINDPWVGYRFQPGTSKPAQP